MHKRKKRFFSLDFNENLVFIKNPYEEPSGEEIAQFHSQVGEPFRHFFNQTAQKELLDAPHQSHFIEKIYGNGVQSDNFKKFGPFLPTLHINKPVE